MNLDELNSFSQQFLQVLLSRLPELAAAARIDTSEAVASGTLLIELDPPSKNVEVGLWISTDDEEVTVGFDYYHGHFDPWIGASESLSFDKACEFIVRILADQALAVSWWIDDVLAGGKWVNPGDDFRPNLEHQIENFNKIMDDMLTGDTWVNPGDDFRPHFLHQIEFNKIRVRSWSGAHDRDIKV
jgi:hypothetical protein